MADAVREETRTAGWGAKEVLAPLVEEARYRPDRSAVVAWSSAKRTVGCGLCAEPSEEDLGRDRRSSRFVVRRRVCGTLPDELDGRETS